MFYLDTCLFLPSVMHMREKPEAASLAQQTGYLPSLSPRTVASQPTSVHQYFELVSSTKQLRYPQEGIKVLDSSPLVLSPRLWFHYHIPLNWITLCFIIHFSSISL
jgi:hypothetical protein